MEPSRIPESRTSERSTSCQYSQYSEDVSKSNTTSQELPPFQRTMSDAMSPGSRLTKFLGGKEKEWAAVAMKDGPLRLLDLPLDLLREILKEVSSLTLGVNVLDSLADAVEGHPHKRPHFPGVDKFSNALSRHTSHLRPIRHRLARCLESYRAKDRSRRSDLRTRYTSDEGRSIRERHPTERGPKPWHLSHILLQGMRKDQLCEKDIWPDGTNPEAPKRQLLLPIHQEVFTWQWSPRMGAGVPRD